MTFDADLWRTASYRCEEEAKQTHADSYLLTLWSQAARFLAENGRTARAITQSYFQAIEMIAKEPKKSYVIMGADVKQTGA